jgi:myo-inositol 2-dehydrogenase/D-chiro-inositol 1-dehydrogenase
MRVAILGYGDQAKLHAAALSRAGTKIAAIGAVDSGRAARFAGKFRVNVGSIEEVIADPSIAAIVIATPTATHARFSITALEAGKHVFCECPIAHSLEDADAMIAAARGAKRHLQIGMVHRFDPPYRHLVDWIRSGDLGHVKAVETTRLSAHMSDGAQKSHHGDAIEELLTFDLHFLAWVFGRPSSLSARTMDVEGRSRHVAAVLEYPELVATCTASSFLPPGHPFTEQTRIFAERGLIELELRLAADRVDWRYEITRPNAATERLPVPSDDPLVEQMRHFVELAGGERSENRADGIAAREMLALTLAAARAARSGETVRHSMTG